jgi:hypothetical protein
MPYQRRCLRYATDDLVSLQSIDRLIYCISILPTGQLHLQGTSLQTCQCRNLARLDRLLRHDPDCISLVNVTKIG